MQGKDVIDFTDISLFEEDEHMTLSEEKEYYTPEETYELVMSDVRSIYNMKDAV